MPQSIAPFSGLKVTVPAILIAGDRDVVLAFRGMDQVISNLRHHVPKLQKTLILPECGHWTQQERPASLTLSRHMGFEQQFSRCYVLTFLSNKVL